MTAWLEINPVIRAVGLALVEFVWQGAAIGAVAMLVLFACRRATAQARYLVACVALAAMAAAPVLSVMAHLDDLRSAMPPDQVSAAVGRAAAGVSSIAQPPMAVEPAASLPFGLDRQLPFVVLIWGLGVVGFTAHLWRGWRRVQRLRAAAIVLESGAWPSRLAALANRLGATTRVRLIESATAAGPFVVGWLRPVIVVPTSALAGLAPSELEAILAHELMHIRRADYLVNVIQCGIEILLFYHPAVWWISRQIRLEREHCCDDLAAEAVGDPVSYASALVALETLRARQPALAVAADGGDLVARVRRLVASEPPSTSSLSGGLAMSTLLTVFMLMLAAQIGRSSSSAQASAAATTDPASAPVQVEEKLQDPPVSVERPEPIPAAPSSERIRGSDAAASAPAVEAQATLSEQFVVIVEDGHGGVLPGANVRLSHPDPDSQINPTGITNAAGRMSLGNLPAGDYALTVEMPGFKASRFTLAVPTARAWVRVRLEIGALSESVTVTAASPEQAVSSPPVVNASVIARGSPGGLDREVLTAARLLLQARNPAALPVLGEPPPLNAPVLVGGDVTAPRKLLHVAPVYPIDAANQGVRGVVILEGTIASDGAFRELRTLRGPAVLADAALQAVSQWRYTPTMLNRVPVDVSVTITVNFALQ